jgi:putative transposase
MPGRYARYVCPVGVSGTCGSSAWRSDWQEAGLDRGILKQGWGQVVTRLEHQAPGRVEKINPGYTSRTADACTHVASAGRASQAVLRCIACGHSDHADINAAKNIADGRSVTARPDELNSARSVKREPRRARPPKVA